MIRHRTRTSRRYRTGPVLCFFLTAVSLVSAVGYCAGGGADQADIGYEYATWLGTGAYRVSDRDVFILRLSFHKRLRRPIDERIGLKLLLPVSVGWLDTGTLVSDDLQTLSFIPGVELDYKVRPQWRLRPYVQLGLGKDLSGDRLAYIGAAGIKSNYKRKHGDYTFTLGNALVVAGSRSDGGGESSTFTRFDAGLEVQRPVDWTIAGRHARLGAFYIASIFGDDANVLRSGRNIDSVGTVHTFGLALGVEKPVRLLGLDIHWVGLSYVSGQVLRGVRLNTGFPF